MNRLAVVAACIALTACLLPFVPMFVAMMAPAPSIDQALEDKYYVVASYPGAFSDVTVVVLHAMVAVLCATLIRDRIPSATMAGWLFATGSAFGMGPRMSWLHQYMTLTADYAELYNQLNSPTSILIGIVGTVTGIAGGLLMIGGWAVLITGALRTAGTKEQN